MDNPRRNRLDLNTPAELAIHEAIQKVEMVGCHERLTKVIVLLGKAKTHLSDYVDDEIARKKVEEKHSWSKEEVENLLYKYEHEKGHSLSSVTTDWIKDHLK